LSKRQYKNFVILHKEIFEKKKNKVEKINFITNKNESKTEVYVLKIMEFNVRIAILQLVDNKQVYEEIPPV
jgi:hypothetical protein